MSGRLRDRFPLESTSTVYMNGKSVYNFVRFGKPGHIASVELFPADAEAIRKEFRAALAEAWDEGKEALAAAILPDAAPLINPYREGSTS
jgi:hypothetical protein